jgi:hypothetical protein
MSVTASEVMFRLGRDNKVQSLSLSAGGNLEVTNYETLEKAIDAANERKQVVVCVKTTPLSHIMCVFISRLTTKATIVPEDGSRRWHSADKLLTCVPRWVPFTRNNTGYTKSLYDCLTKLSVTRNQDVVLGDYDGHPAKDAITEWLTESEGLKTFDPVYVKIIVQRVGDIRGLLSAAYCDKAKKDGRGKLVCEGCAVDAVLFDAALGLMAMLCECEVKDFPAVASAAIYNHYSGGKDTDDESVKRFGDILKMIGAKAQSNSELSVEVTEKICEVILASFRRFIGVWVATEYHPELFPKAVVCKKTT